METQGDAVEDNVTDDQFILLQSDLNKLKILRPTLAPYGTTNEGCADVDQTRSMAESTTTEILDHCCVSHSIVVTSDNDDEESSEEHGPPKTFTALELLQNCIVLEEEQVASHL